MTRKLLVRRKGFTTRSGKRVKPTTFMIRDRGRKGRGPKIIPELTPGRLGVSFKNKAATRRKKEIVMAKQIGEKKVVGKLRAIQVLNKNTNPTVSRKARADARFIASSFSGRKRVRTGTGLTKRRRS